MSSFRRIKRLVISSFLHQDMQVLVKICRSEILSMTEFKPKFQEIVYNEIEGV